MNGVLVNAEIGVQQFGSAQIKALYDPETAIARIVSESDRLTFPPDGQRTDAALLTEFWMTLTAPDGTEMRGVLPLQAHVHVRPDDTLTVVWPAGLMFKLQQAARNTTT